MGRHAACRGVTLPELAIALGVVAVLVAAAAPEMATWLRRTELRAQADGLLASLQLARSEAIRRNGRVVLCKSPDGEGCAASGGWEQGHILFEDSNNNAERDATETILHREAGANAALVIIGNGNVQDYVSYSWNGLARLQSGALQMGTITVCRRSASPTESRNVIINAGGRPRLQTATVDACG